MIKRSFSLLFSLLTAVILLTFMAACAGNQDPVLDTHTHDGGEAHTHGPDTHTHDAAMTADTAGTYVDTEGGFFEEEPHEHDAVEEPHEHGPETHTHEEGSPGHQ